MTDTHTQLLRLITGYWITQLIYVAAKLGLADLLAAGPKTSDDLAAEGGVRPRELHRLLRALASEGVFQEAAPRTFANTPLSDWLRQERTGSLHARAIVSAEKDWPAWGQLLTLILARHATQRGILFDAPRVIETAGELLRAARVAERCELRAGDFFKAIPGHGDAYLMSHILHDWDDEPAKKLLTRTRSVMKPGTRLLIIEKLIPPGNEPSLAKLMDIHMLVLSGGLERTEEEYRRLLTDTGFHLERIVPTASIMSVLEARPV